MVHGNEIWIPTYLEWSYAIDVGQIFNRPMEHPGKRWKILKVMMVVVSIEAKIYGSLSPNIFWMHVVLNVLVTILTSMSMLFLLQLTICASMVSLRWRYNYTPCSGLEAFRHVVTHVLWASFVGLGGFPKIPNHLDWVVYLPFQTLRNCKQLVDFTMETCNRSKYHIVYFIIVYRHQNF